MNSTDIKGPSVAEMAAGVGKAFTLWVRDGFATLGQGEIDARLAVCEAHPECWQRGGLGVMRCKACGCTSLKFALPASRCPRGFW